MNKKLINLKGIKQILNDPELKNIMGGSYGVDPICQQSVIEPTYGCVHYEQCIDHQGLSGECRTMWIGTKYDCACVAYSG